METDAHLTCFPAVQHLSPDVNANSQVGLKIWASSIFTYKEYQEQDRGNIDGETSGTCTLQHRQIETGERSNTGGFAANKMKNVHETNAYCCHWLKNMFDKTSVSTVTPPSYYSTAMVQINLKYIIILRSFVVMSRSHTVPYESLQIPWVLALFVALLFQNTYTHTF